VKLTTPAELIDKESVSDAEPIVLPSPIIISSVNVAMPVTASVPDRDTSLFKNVKIRNYLYHHP
jgi:hypothetical protein